MLTYFSMSLGFPFSPLISTFPHPYCQFNPYFPLSWAFCDNCLSLGGDAAEANLLQCSCQVISITVHASSRRSSMHNLQRSSASVLSVCSRQLSVCSSVLFCQSIPVNRVDQKRSSYCVNLRSTLPIGRKFVGCCNTASGWVNHPGHTKKQMWCTLSVSIYMQCNQSTMLEENIKIWYAVQQTHILLRLTKGYFLLAQRCMGWPLVADRSIPHPIPGRGWALGSCAITICLVQQSPVELDQHAGAGQLQSVPLLPAMLY
jgi:hypothetical protein